jgi:hypothetical protein
MRYAKLTRFPGIVGLLLAVASVAAAAAPVQWTILREVCWRIQADPNGQCAVGLAGIFDSKEACIAANGGQLMQKQQQTGMARVTRCEVLLQQ